MFAGALVSDSLLHMLPYLFQKKKKIKCLRYRKKANYLNYSYGLHIDYFSYVSASCGVMCVTLIKLHFKHENCDQYHLLFS